MNVHDIRRDRHRYSLTYGMAATLFTVAFISAADVFVVPLFRDRPFPDYVAFTFPAVAIRSGGFMIFWYVVVRSAWNRGYRRAEYESGQADHFR